MHCSSSYIKSFFFGFCLILLIGLSSSGCKKRPFNERNKYIGDWIFTEHRQVFEQWPDSTGSWQQTVIETTERRHIGKTRYKGRKGNIIVFSWNEGSHELEVTEDGSISVPEDERGLGQAVVYNVSGTFSDDDNFAMRVSGSSEPEKVTVTMFTGQRLD